MARRLVRGFTLLELLIALSVFSILSVMAYSGLRTVLDSRERTLAQADRLTELQTAFLFLQKDIEQTVGRSIRDEYGDPKAAMLGSPFGTVLFELTRAGYRNPAGTARSNLQRVSYRVDEGKLTRVSWAMLDQPNTPKLIERPLLTKVKKFVIRYLDSTRQWQDTWPPTSASATGQAALNKLPQAVEVEVEFEDIGSVKRLFRVPPGEAVTKAKQMPNPN